MKLQRLEPRVRNVSLSAVEANRDASMRGATAHMRLRGRALQARNARIALRDVYTCQICGCVVDHGEVDHRVPLAEGGSDDAMNLQWLCVECHRAKTDRENARQAGA